MARDFSFIGGLFLGLLACRLILFSCVINLYWSVCFLKLYCPGLQFLLGTLSNGIAVIYLIKVTFTGTFWSGFGPLSFFFIKICLTVSAISSSRCVLTAGIFVRNFLCGTVPYMSISYASQVNYSSYSFLFVSRFLGGLESCDVNLQTWEGESPLLLACQNLPTSRKVILNCLFPFIEK